MYLRGLRGFGRMGDGAFDQSGAAAYPDNPDAGTIYDASTAPSDTGPTVSGDWTGIISSAIATWGNVQQSKIQAQGAADVARYTGGRYLPATAPRTYTSSPFVSGAAGSWAQYLLPLGLVAGAAYLILK